MVKEKDKEKKKKIPRTNLEKSLEGLSEIGSGDFLKLKEGKNTVRILPYKEMFFFKATLHYGMQQGDRQTAYPCLSMFGKKSCPVCDFHEELSKSTSEGKLKLAQRIRQVTKYYVNLIDRDRPQDGIKMLGMTPKMMRQLRGFLEDEDYGDVTDPDDGRDVVITREGSGFTGTRYELRVRGKPTPIDYENWDEELNDLEADVVKEVSSDFLKRRVDELKTSVKSGKAPKEEEEEEEEEEEKGEEEDEEED